MNTESLAETFEVDLVFLFKTKTAVEIVLQLQGRTCMVDVPQSTLEDSSRPANVIIDYLHECAQLLKHYLEHKDWIVPPAKRWSPYR